MRRHVLQCAIAGASILIALVVILLWMPYPSEFRHDCERAGGSFVAGVDGGADLCIGPAATAAAAAPASPTAR